MELLTAGILGLLGFIGYVALKGDIAELKPKKRSPKKKDEGSRKELVYILANPSYRSGVFKIGLTTREISVRMRELFTTGVPTPFIKCIILETDDCKQLEAALHSEFKSKRINNRREWFDLKEGDLARIIHGAKAGGYTVVSNDVEAGKGCLSGRLHELY